MSWVSEACLRTNVHRTAYSCCCTSYRLPQSDGCAHQSRHPSEVKLPLPWHVPWRFHQSGTSGRRSCLFLHRPASGTFGTNCGGGSPLGRGQRCSMQVQSVPTEDHGGPVSFTANAGDLDMQEGPGGDVGLDGGGKQQRGRGLDMRLIVRVRRARLTNQTRNAPSLLCTDSPYTRLKRAIYVVEFSIGGCISPASLFGVVDAPAPHLQCL